MDLPFRTKAKKPAPHPRSKAKHSPISWILLGVAALMLGWGLWANIKPLLFPRVKAATLSLVQSPPQEAPAPQVPQQTTQQSAKGQSPDRALKDVEAAQAWSDLILGGIDRLVTIIAGLGALLVFRDRKRKGKS